MTDDGQRAPAFERIAVAMESWASETDGAKFERGTWFDGRVAFARCRLHRDGHVVAMDVDTGDQMPPLVHGLLLPETLDLLRRVMAAMEEPDGR
jgi:hypothetical protein